MFDTIKENIKSIFSRVEREEDIYLYSLKNNCSAVFDYSFLMSLDENNYIYSSVFACYENGFLKKSKILCESSKAYYKAYLYHKEKISGAG